MNISTATRSSGSASSQIIHVVSCCDANMAAAVAVVAQSIFDHARHERPVHFHAICSDESPLLHRAAAALQSNAFAMSVHHSALAQVGLRVSATYPPAAYLRLLIPAMLPDIAKVLYLDADTLVLNELSELFEIDLYGQPVAATPDYALWHFESGLAVDGPDANDAIRRLRDDLGIAYTDAPDYFNTGVLLMDLDVWRHSDLTAQTFEAVRTIKHLPLVDQDALNSILKGQYTRLKPEWNAFAGLISKAPARPDGWDAIKDAWSHCPRILHFSGITKPWLAHHLATPFDALYWECAMRSPAAREIRALYKTSKKRHWEMASKIPRKYRRWTREWLLEKLRR